MMRKSLVALAVLAIIGVLAAPVFAQAPAPKVTINGLVDNVTSYTRNLSEVDLNYDRTGDREWYARTRVRPDITAEVGTTKFVLGLEIDQTWGQTGAADNTAPNRFGTSSSWDLNTDTIGNIEVKWAYTEFDTPWIPGSRLRLGAQPWAATYKTAVLATGDFAGAHWTWSANPMLRLNATYGQVEENGTGPADNFTRGDDWAFIGSVEVSPFKGLDIRPIYAYLHAESGNTSGASRQGRGGVAAVLDENRHTLGVDMRWKAGPFTLDPTAFFQFGERQLVAGGSEQDIAAWFFDVRGGWQAGPLLLEAAAIYTTGNKAGEDVRTAGEDVNFYQPISTDTSFYAGWAEIFALGIDYFNILYATAPGLQPGTAIGYDKYGLIRLGARASYAITPAFTARAATTASWTAEKVDTDSTLAAASGLTPSAGAGGDERFLGWEVNLGLTYRFVPNVALDLVGSYLFAGDALGYAAGPRGGSPDPDDVQALTARVRYTF